MKVSVDSLNDYLKIKLSTERMVELLLQTEVEVEEIVSASTWDENIVTVKVEEVRPHPDADRLRIARVTTGHEEIEVVCGGANLAVGQVAVLAKSGAIMPDGTKIKTGKIRGVVSAGMLCAAEELGVPGSEDGIIVLPETTPLGLTLCDVWKKGDTLDIKTPANRWDFLSLVGLAREVAARDEGNNLVIPEKSDLTYSDIERVEVKEVGECKRFVSVKLRVDNSVKSPDWLVDNLEANGLRSISPVVDVTNYVMLEIGQPSHAFDADKLSRKITVRYASPAETITTLDGTHHKLTAEDLVIADSDGPLDIAGVMGGAQSEVSKDTTEILLTVANFDRTVVRRAALRHGNRSEASARYERSLPLPLTPLAMERLVYLLERVAKAEIIDSPSDQLYGWPWVQHIGLRLRRAEQLLGVKLDEKQVVGGLKKLGFEVDHFSITKEAKKHLGKPYIWGANFRNNGEDGFDCSYLIDRLYSKIGVSVGHTALGQFHHGWPVEIGELRPGDVVFYAGKIEKSTTDHYYVSNPDGGHTRVDLDSPMEVGHNGIYVGDNKVIMAAMYERKGSDWVLRDKQGVIEVPLSDFTNDPGYKGARRYVDNFNHILAITAPWWRTDVRVQEDVVEDIVKIIGYDAIPATLPDQPATNTRPHQLLPRIIELKKSLVSAGLQEIVTYSFISGKMISDLGGESRQHLEIANPLSREQQYLRRELLPNHLQMVKNNLGYAKQFVCFEVAKTYEPTEDGQLPVETWKLGVTAVGNGSALRVKSVLDLAADKAGWPVEFSNAAGNDAGDNYGFVANRRAQMLLQGKVVGSLGQISKQILDRFGITSEVSYGEIELVPLLGAVNEPVIKDLPDHQLIRRDISLICDDSLEWAKLSSFVGKQKLITRVDYLGFYQDEAMAKSGRKSLTMRLTLDMGPNPSSSGIEAKLTSIRQLIESNPDLGGSKVS